MARSRILRSTVIALAFAGSTARAATITVTTAVDNLIANNGSVSLREAITAINAGSTADPNIIAQAPGVFGVSDTITFNIGGAGVQTINVGADATALNIPLPTLVKPVLINGYTQGVASVNTLANGDNAVILVELNGTSAGAGSSGFSITSGGSGSTIKGFVVNRFVTIAGNGGHGFLLNGSSNNTVTGNFIGVNSAGTAASSNGGAGFFLLNASANNTLGGTTPAARNVISSNSNGGITLGNTGTTGNLIQGNFIGTNASGTAAIGSPGGITINGASGNTIGGSVAGARNVISGNAFTGVFIENLASNNAVQGNFIGIGADGVTPLGNTGAFGGVYLSAGLSGGASNNTIGGTFAGVGNIIAFNVGNGVTVGPDFNGFSNVGNTILGNTIFSNTSLGIDLNNDGVTTNDACDADPGPNNLQNYPVITSAIVIAGNTNILGTLNSTANTAFRIELFSTSACNAVAPNDFGEGQTFLGSVVVTTNPSCVANINVSIPFVVSGVITSTATLLNAGLPVETSEFSQCVLVGAVTNTPTNTPTSTPVNTSTNTPPGNPQGGVVVPTLSPSRLGLLALALAAAALFLMRRDLRP